MATGIFNAGASIGPILVPLLVPFLTVQFGWRGAFVATGAFGFVWLAFWLKIYRKPQEHPAVSPEELEHIQSDPPEKVQSVPWLRLIPLRETWAFAMGKFLSDPVWWFYLFWLPRYLQETFHLDMNQNRLPVLTVYIFATVGGLAGGWLSSRMLKSGRSLNASRKITLLICALIVLPVLYAPFATNLWVVVTLVGLVMAAHQGWSANLFTLVSDMFPRGAVGSVVGFGGMVGSAGGVMMQLLAGRIPYIYLFAFTGTAYLLALLIIHLLSPKLAPARLD